MSKQADTIMRTSLVDQVAQAIVRLIDERSLGEGDAIPAAVELSAEFAVSRTVVREAIAQLAGRGLLRRQQGREGVVTVPGSGELAELLAYRMQHEQIRLVDLQQFRHVIEVAGAELAASSVQRDQHAELRTALARLLSASGADSLNDADVDLHRCIVVLAANPLFVLVLDSLTPLLRTARRTTWRAFLKRGGQPSTEFARHEALVEAIIAGDSVLAGRLMREDIDQATKELAEHESLNSFARRSP